MSKPLFWKKGMQTRQYEQTSCPLWSPKSSTIIQFIPFQPFVHRLYWSWRFYNLGHLYQTRFPVCFLKDACNVHDVLYLKSKCPESFPSWYINGTEGETLLEAKETSSYTEVCRPRPSEIFLLFFLKWISVPSNFHIMQGCWVQVRWLFQKKNWSILFLWCPPCK